MVVDCNAGGIVFLHYINNFYTEYAGTLTMPDGLYCLDMQFVNEDTGYIAGLFDSETGTSHTIKTTDGGDTWLYSSEFEGPDLAISFPSTKIGYGFSNNYHLWKTQDYADTWEQLPWVFNEDVPGFNFDKVYFYNDSVGFDITQYGTPDHYEVLRTIDGGATWDTTLFESDEYDDTWFLAFFCTSPDTCYLTSTAGIFKTTNGAGLPAFPTQINENQDIDLTFYPNPADFQINISCANKNEIESILTTNYLGEKVNIIWNPDLRANVSGLVSGIYITEIITDGGKGINKWIKN